MDTIINSTTWLYCEECGEPVYTVDDYPMGWEHGPIDAYECSDNKDILDHHDKGPWCAHKSYHALTYDEKILKFGEKK